MPVISPIGFARCWAQRPASTGKPSRTKAEHRPCGNPIPVGAGLAREEAPEIAKSFAGKPCSYRLCGVFKIPFLHSALLANAVTTWSSTALTCRPPTR
ncbi:hypothetical protein C3F00_029315 [Pseudomonas sp. MWU13-2860]|nr:hypothetical protein C3F00_029315 [Pseudomonas sp. MWU13-2860]